MKKVILFVLGLLFLVWLFDTESDSKTYSKDKSYSKIEAYDFLTMQIEKQILKDPKSAEYPDLQTKISHTKKISSKKFHIDSYVNSKNGFGGMARTYFESDVVFNESGGVSFPNFKVKN